MASEETEAISVLDLVRSLVRSFSDKDPYARVRIVDAVAKLEKKGYEEVVKELISILSDDFETWGVRIGASELLGKMAKKGDEAVIKALLSLLPRPSVDGWNDNRNGNWQIQSSVAESLGKVAETGDKNVIKALYRLLSHDRPDVRKSAVISLGMLVEEEDGTVIERVIEALSRILSDTNWAIRKSAAESLRHLAEKGNEKVFDDLLRSFRTAVSYNMIRILELLPIMTPKGNEKVIDAFLSRFKSDPFMDVYTKRRMISVLGEIAENGNEAVISTLIDFLTDEKDSSIQEKAAEALGNLAEKGNREVINALISRLSRNNDYPVRQAATDSLMKLVDEGDRETANAILSLNIATGPRQTDEVQSLALFLIPLISDGDPAVRKNAIQSLRKMARWGNENEKVIDALLPFLDVKKEIDPNVQLDVIQTLKEVSTKGNEKVIDALLPFLDVKNEIDLNVRKGVIQALGEVSTKGNEKVIDVILGTEMENTKRKFWPEAFAALKKLAEKGNKKVIERMIPILLDNETQPSTHRNAIGVLTSATNQGNENVIKALDTFIENNEDVRSKKKAKALRSDLEVQSKSAAASSSDIRSKLVRTMISMAIQYNSQFALEKLREHHPEHF